MVAFSAPAVGVAGPPRTCPHLAPLEQLLAAVGHPVGPAHPCPHDPDWGTWFDTKAPLDADRIGRQLYLDGCVHGEAYEGRLAVGGDVTFYCDRCRCAIVGPLPAVAGAR